MRLDNPHLILASTRGLRALDADIDAAIAAQSPVYDGAAFASPLTALCNSCHTVTTHYARGHAAPATSADARALHARLIRNADGGAR